MEIDGNTILFIFVILYFLYSSPSGDGVTSQYEYNQLQTLRAQYNDEHSQFANMTLSENFRNITGLKLSYEDVLKSPGINATYPIAGKDYNHWSSNQGHMILPESVITEIREDVWSGKEGVFPPNITSTLHGLIKLDSNKDYQKVPMPVPEYYEPPHDFSQNFNDPYVDDGTLSNGQHNVTFNEGQVVIEIKAADTALAYSDARRPSFFNSQSDRWRMLHVNLHFSDFHDEEKHSINSRAVYDIKRGRILAISESAKFHSLFAFPHYMSLKEDDKLVFDEVKLLVEEYWNASNFVDTRTMNYLQESYAVANYKCEFLAYFQLSPWSAYNPEQLKVIDDELTWPLGRRANLSSLPPINISSGIVYSPDCGINLRVSSVSGPRYELHVRKMRDTLLFGIVLLASQIYLLLIQMQHTNTPSMVNKISYWCFSLMNSVDGSLAIIFFFMTSAIPELYLPLVICSFACLILASVFEMRYLISIYASQANEQNVSFTTLLRRNTGPEERNAPTVIPDEATISSHMYRRYILMMFLSMVLILSVATWSRRIRTPFECVAFFVLNSYWVPQIARNAIKGNEPRRRRASPGESQAPRQNKMPLLWSFVIGTSIIRFLPVAYVFTVPSNIFYHHRDIRYVVIVALWILFQIVILYSQDIMGARWFLPKYTIPEGYSYHKGISSADLLEHGSSPNYSIDCAICMNDVPVYVDDIPKTHKVDKESYMITPCSHIFHTQCLESWMSYKLQCPVCRAPLPPL